MTCVFFMEIADTTHTFQDPQDPVTGSVLKPKFRGEFDRFGVDRDLTESSTETGAKHPGTFRQMKEEFV